MDKNIHKISVQDGVALYYVQNDDGTNKYIDIDVEDDVKSVSFIGIPSINGLEIASVELFDIKKVFPSVKSILIGKDIENININNKMFPNVRCVNSNNDKYKSGNMLVKIMRFDANGRCYKKPEYRLLNSFCLLENEVLDVTEIDVLEQYAICGCLTDKIKGSEHIHTFYDSTFEESAFLTNDYIDGCKMAGSLLLDVDENNENIIIPDDVVDLHIVTHRISEKTLKKITIHNIKTLQFLGRLPEELVLDFDVNYDDIELISEKERNQSLKKITVTEKSLKYKSIDGIIYSKDGKCLAKCPITKEHVDIPDAVESIGTKAFQNNRNISEIKFPQNVKNVLSSAFDGCYNLKSITLNEGLQKIADNAFKGNPNLRFVDIPESVEYIGVNNFESVIKFTMKRPPDFLVNEFTKKDNGNLISVEFNIDGRPYTLLKSSLIETKTKKKGWYETEETKYRMGMTFGNTECRNNVCEYVKNLIEHKRYEEVKEFFGYNLISNEEVKSILEQYSENENVEAAAFLLECLDDGNKKDILKID